MSSLISSLEIGFNSGSTEVNPHRANKHHSDEWILEPAVKARWMAASKMYEVVEVGEEKLVGEVIKVTGQIAKSANRQCQATRGKQMESVSVLGTMLLPAGVFSSP